VLKSRTADGVMRARISDAPPLIISEQRPFQCRKKVLYTHSIYAILFKMVLKGEGSVQSVDGKTWIYIPKSLAEDSSFPFKKGDKVTIEIKEKEIVIRMKGK